MIAVKLVDSTFSHNATIGLAGERLGERPAAFHWDTTPGPAAVKVWTDIRLAEAVNDPAPRKIAWLIESPAIGASSYDWIRGNAGVFDYVLTCDRELAESGPPFLFAPIGGSWVKNWGLFPKSHLVSILLSEKKLTIGHRLRHEAAALLPPEHCYGRGVGKPLPGKTAALRPYRYSIIVENGRVDWYFTEKLIDALSQGTVPLYWGCPGIGQFFNAGGIIAWETLDELAAILPSLDASDYERRLPAIRDNLERARQYACCEDWVWARYPHLLS